MNATVRLGVVTAAAAAVLGFGAASALAAAAGPVAPLPSWDELKSLTVDEAIKKVPGDLLKETTSNPFYPSFKDTKLEALPGFLPTRSRRSWSARRRPRSTLQDSSRRGCPAMASTAPNGSGPVKPPATGPDPAGTTTGVPPSAPPRVTLAISATF